MALTKTEIDARYYHKHRKTRLREAAKYRAENKTKVRRWGCRNRKAVYARFIVQPINRLTSLFKKAVVRAKTRGLKVEGSLLDRLRKNPPTRCACCNRKLDYSCGRGRQRDASPSLDRRNNRAGYTLANTFVVCYRCNRIKADATWQELKRILKYVRRQTWN